MRRFSLLCVYTVRVQCVCEVNVSSSTVLPILISEVCMRTSFSRPRVNRGAVSRPPTPVKKEAVAKVDANVLKR